MLGLRPVDILKVHGANKAKKKSPLKFVGTQSVLVEKTGVSVDQARAAVRKAGYKTDKVDAPGEFYRFRQFDPPTDKSGFVYQTVDSKNIPGGKLIQLYKRR